jgi:hypothetical protein
MPAVMFALTCSGMLLWAGPFVPIDGPPTARAANRAPVRAADQGVEDIGPLSDSLRRVELRPAQPMDFDQLLIIDGLGGSYARGNGALYAVFPRSVYSGPRHLAEIPADTVFRIGLPRDPFGPVRSARPAPSRDRIDHSVLMRPEDLTLRVTDPSPSTPRDPVLQSPSFRIASSLPPPIVADPEYRRARLGSLIARAAAAERAAVARVFDAAPVVDDETDAAPGSGDAEVEVASKDGASASSSREQ